MPSGKAQYELRTQELLKLAQAIADAGPPLEVPESVIDVVQDVIAGRQECADWYATMPDAATVEKENESHRFFIEVCMLAPPCSLQKLTFTRFCSAF